MSLDVHANEDAHESVLVTPGDSWTDQSKDIHSKLAAELGPDKLDAVVCVAGGWAGGNSASDSKTVIG